MALEPDQHDQLLAALRPLRAFALSLIRDADRADDLVHETVARALSNLHRFERGTDFQAWLFTILRNLFYSQMRQRGREVADSDGLHAARLVSIPEQMGHMAFRDLQSALQKLPPKQREVLILVGAHGLPYEEVARICGCAVGTIKSRLCRARELLARLMDETSTEGIGHDSLTLAALNKAA